MTTTSELDEFVHLQARPSLIFNRPGPRPGTGKTFVTPTSVRYATVPAVDIATSPDRLARTPFSRHATGPARWSELTELVCAAGYQRFEPSHHYNPHRGYPSAQSLNPAEIFLVNGTGAWHFDPLALSIRAVAGTEQPRPVDPQSTSIAVLGRPQSLPEYYRELQWSLTLLECGHLLELVWRLADAVGFRPALRTDFVDAGLLDRIGAEPGDAWLPAGIIDLGTPSPTGPPAPRDHSSKAMPDPVLTIDRAGWSSTPVLPPLPAVGRPDRDTEISWADALFDRSSGRSVGGFAAAPTSMQRAALDRALSDVAASGRAWETVGTRTVLLTRSVDDLPDGIYEFDSQTRNLALLRGGRFLDDVQRAFFYPPTVTSVTSCNAVLLHLVDYDEVRATLGTRGLRLSQLQLGAQVQAAALSLSVDGYFCRPCRSFDTDRLASLIGAESHTVAYLSLIGTSRFTDLSLDLRP